MKVRTQKVPEEWEDSECSWTVSSGGRMFSGGAYATW